jgi:hypothetical protein
MVLEFSSIVNFSIRGISLIDRIARNVFDGHSVVLHLSLLELNSISASISSHSIALDLPFKPH